ncbi:MAG: 2-dehydropantoate 2-reductase [Bacillota bacterium]
MRVALMGVGSLGTIIGALIVKNGGEITLIEANREHVDALNRRGATVTGELELKTPVSVITPDRMEGIYDLVFYLVKQTDNNEALQQLLPYLGENSVVCTMQNGVPEDAVSAVVGRERTLGCSVGWGATWLEPGVSMLTSEPAKMVYYIGELDGKITDRVKSAAEILSLSGKAEISTNLMGMRWIKLLVNATFSGMSAALGCTYGDVMDDAKAMACVAHIANETLQVARALGVTVEPIFGRDLRILEFRTWMEMESRLPIIEEVLAPYRLLKASMLQDLEKGKKTEIDAINGVICAYGRKVNIATPINDQVVEIVRGAEAGVNGYTFSNLDRFVLPELPEE